MKKRISVPLLFLLVGSMLSATNCGNKEQIRKDIVRITRDIEAKKPVYGKYIKLKDPRTGMDVMCPMDCSGFVLTVYKFANISFFEEQKGKIEEKNGVKFIYKALKNAKKIYRIKIPNAADIVFFNNTWDSNYNGKVNDELTHVGIVLFVDENGTITFIHSSRKEGVNRDCVNLYHPEKEKLCGVTINSKIRPRENTDPPDTKYLAGELFNAFGTVFDVPQEGDD
jgi:hypothetical protein